MCRFTINWTGCDHLVSQTNVSTAHKTLEQCLFHVQPSQVTAVQMAKINSLYANIGMEKFAHIASDFYAKNLHLSVDQSIQGMSGAHILQFMVRELRRRALEEQVAENEARLVSSGRSSSAPPAGVFMGSKHTVHASTSCGPQQKRQGLAQSAPFQPSPDNALVEQNLMCALDRFFQENGGNGVQNAPTQPPVQAQLPTQVVQNDVQLQSSRPRQSQTQSKTRQAQKTSPVQNARVQKSKKAPKSRQKGQVPAHAQVQIQDNLQTHIQPRPGIRIIQDGPVPSTNGQVPRVQNGPAQGARQNTHPPAQGARQNMHPPAQTQTQTQVQAQNGGEDLNQHLAAELFYRMILHRIIPAPANLIREPEAARIFNDMVKRGQVNVAAMVRNTKFMGPFNSPPPSPPRSQPQPQPQPPAQAQVSRPVQLAPQSAVPTCQPPVQSHPAPAPQHSIQASRPIQTQPVQAPTQVPRPVQAQAPQPSFQVSQPPAQAPQPAPTCQPPVPRPQSSVQIQNPPQLDAQLQQPLIQPQFAPQPSFQVSRPPAQAPQPAPTCQPPVPRSQSSVQTQNPPQLDAQLQQPLIQPHQGTPVPSSTCNVQPEDLSLPQSFCNGPPNQPPSPFTLLLNEIPPPFNMETGQGQPPLPFNMALPIHQDVSLEPSDDVLMDSIYDLIDLDGVGTSPLVPVNPTDPFQDPNLTPSQVMGDLDGVNVDSPLFEGTSGV